MKNTTCGFIGIILIILVAVVLGVGSVYYATKSKSEVKSETDIATNTTAGSISDNSSPAPANTNSQQVNPAVNASVDLSAPVNVNMVTKVDVVPKPNTERYLGKSYGFSYPYDWRVWEANPVLGLTIVFPKNKEDKMMNKDLPTTESVNIAFLENKSVDLSGTSKVTLGGEIWYTKTLKGGIIEYYKEYNPSKYVVIDSGLSNKAMIEIIASSWIQG